MFADKRSRIVGSMLAVVAAYHGLRMTPPPPPSEDAPALLRDRGEALVIARPEGLYCPPGDFYIDPSSPVPRAVITHGHGDHARAGHDHVLATRETLAIMAGRYGADCAGATQALAYGETLTIGEVTLRQLLATWSVHDLDHISQIYAGLAGSRDAAVGPWKVYAGILLRRTDPAAKPG